MSIQQSQEARIYFSIRIICVYLWALELSAGNPPIRVYGWPNRYQSRTRPRPRPRSACAALIPTGSRIDGEKKSGLVWSRSGAGTVLFLRDGYAEGNVYPWKALVGIRHSNLGL